MRFRQQTIRKIEEVLYRSYNGLPPKGRALVRPVVHAFFSLEKVFSLVSQFRLSVHLLYGKEKWSGNHLTTLFLGSGLGLSYLSSLLYLEEPVKENLGKVFIWRIKSRLIQNPPKVDLICVKMDGFFSRFFSRLGFMIIPEWTLFMMDLSKQIPEVSRLSKNNTLRENLRRIRKNDYSYEMTQDPSKFEYFYYQMYLPYLTKRFKELTVVTAFRDMERIFRKGLLLLVKKGNDYISGEIIRTDHDKVFALYVGIAEGREEYLKAGALSASYYYFILWAKERGYKSVDFGHCRSFLKDGVFKYKKSWGMEIMESTRQKYQFGMKICSYHQGVRNFLEKNPFIFIDQEKLKGLILVGENHPVTLKEVRTLFKTYSIHGLHCLVILSDRGFTQEAEEFGCSNPGLHLIGSKPDVFFETFPLVLHSTKT